MKPTLRAKLDSLVARLADLERLLASEDATRDMEKFRNYSREHADVSAIAALYEAYRKAEGDAGAARELELPEEVKAANGAM
ncbi:MAG TPA: PCRF domain-containing protein, partial [Burkholderiales bacterium]|nr:PCRF domain-containing protein [Burkholderiales bacterium]